MPIPTGYRSVPFGGLARTSNSSGPFATPESTPSGDYVQLESGFWMNRTDGSGPFFLNTSTKQAQLTPIFRRI